VARGYLCDRCGEGMTDDECTGFQLTMLGPDSQTIRTLEVLDFCPKCARSVASVVRTRIITTSTREGAWEVSGVSDPCDTPGE